MSKEDDDDDDDDDGIEAYQSVYLSEIRHLVSHLPSTEKEEKKNRRRGGGRRRRRKNSFPAIMRSDASFFF